MPNQTSNVFVSYSHADATLVAPVVKLLRANRSLVFQDIDSIQPGKKWRSEILKGLAESDLVVVFWCDHASRSEEVCTEWKAAIEREKDLLPLLLDATPLPPELGDYQWIDFRETVGANHASIVSSPNDAEPGTLMEGAEMPEAKARSSRWPLFGGFAAALVAIVIGGVLYMQREPTSPMPQVPPVAGGPLPPYSSIPGFFVLGCLLLFLAVMGFLAWWLFRWRRKRKRPLGRLETPLDITSMRFPEISQIAQKIEEEILRRTALKHDPGA
jgi:hypothetical protein